MDAVSEELRRAAVSEQIAELRTVIAEHGRSRENSLLRADEFLDRAGLRTGEADRFSGPDERVVFEEDDLAALEPDDEALGEWAWAAGIGRLRVLPREDQARCGFAVEAGVLAKAVLDGELEVALHADWDELRELVLEGEAAFEELYLGNLRLVFYWARKYGSGDRFVTEECFQDGSFGLWRAIQGWDALRGYAFSTYATWHIRQSITRGLAARFSVLHIPVHIQEEWAKAGEGEVSRAAARARLVTDGLESLESLIEDTGGAIGEDVTVPGMEEMFVETEWRRVFAEALGQLPSREGEILAMRIGMAYDMPQTLAEAGLRFGVTRERARQIEKMALGHLRKYWLTVDSVWNPGSPAQVLLSGGSHLGVSKPSARERDVGDERLACAAGLVDPAEWFL